MRIALITGSGGLVGVESVVFFSKHFDLIIGIDNDSRGYFFGKGGSVAKNIDKLVATVDNYEHYPVDIRDRERIRTLFSKYGDDIKLIVNAAAQPSHDWSGKYPFEDFEINALGAVILLEEMRIQAPNAVFIQCSSSKVYGDALNSFEYEESADRYDLPRDHTYFNGFREDLHVDQSLHSPYGAGKLSSDVMCQEFTVLWSECRDLPSKLHNRRSAFWGGTTRIFVIFGKVYDNLQGLWLQRKTSSR